jgi:hypothetical protein
MEKVEKLCIEEVIIYSKLLLKYCLKQIYQQYIWECLTYVTVKYVKEFEVLRHRIAFSKDFECIYKKRILSTASWEINSSSDKPSYETKIPINVYYSFVGVLEAGTV